MKRTALFWLALILLVYGVIEVFAFAAFSLATRSRFSFKALEAERQQWQFSTDDAFGLDDIPARYRIRKEVLHPYLGFVHDPTVEPSSPYGISDIEPIQTRSPDRVVIGFFGGSFAEDIVYNAWKKMVEELKPLFPGKEFVIVKAAMGGYKQPQQLMAYNYFTALGGEFDIVINLDGFNEIALPVTENIPATSPFFPRQWNLRLKMVPDSALLSAVGEIQFLDAVSRRWAALFTNTPLRYSVTMNVIWWAGDRLLYNRATDRRARLPEASAKSNEFAGTGPPSRFASEADTYGALTRMWAESSYQMHVLAAARGSRYFHFLQPNQYVEGSKPMSAEERKVAIREGHPYGESVKKSYGLLQNLGKDLQRRGVDFVDLTPLFKDNRTVLYRDNCCHVNFVGDDIVAAAIGKAIAARLRHE